MLYRGIGLLMLLAISLGRLNAQGFTEVPIGIPGFYNSQATWVDYDNDGKLDISISGTDTVGAGGYFQSSRLYRNTGSGFQEVTPGFAAIYEHTQRWLDYDHDGDMDYFVFGEDSVSDYHGYAYRNNGGTFTPVQIGFPSRAYGSMTSGDIRNDGGMDIISIALDTAFAPTTSVLVFDGNQYQQISNSIPNLRDGDCSLFDADNDGDLDFFASGKINFSAWSTVLTTNDGGNFGTNGWLAPTIETPSFSIGDYDADGDLDIATSGFANAARYTDILENNGGIFSALNAGLGLLQGTVQWGDLDNDGDLDLVATGIVGSASELRIFQNNAGTFVNTGIPLQGVLDQALFADYDKDGDLDLLIQGQIYQGSAYAKLFRNDIGSPVNTPPAAPIGIRQVINAATSITF